MNDATSAYTFSESAGSFRATSVWHGILQCLLCIPAHPKKVSNGATHSCFSGKDILSNLVIYLESNSDKFPDSSPEAAIRLCQQLLDTGAIFVVQSNGSFGLRKQFTQHSKFDAKPTTWYGLDRESPCIAPFISCSNIRFNNEMVKSSSRSGLISCRISNSDEMSGFSKKLKERSWSCTEVNKTSQVSNNFPDVLQRLPRDIFGSIASIRRSIRKDVCETGNMGPTLDFYIHHLCLQQLLKLIDLSMIDQLVYTESLLASANKSKIATTNDFMDLDESTSELLDSPSTPFEEGVFLATNQFTRSLSKTFSNFGWTDVFTVTELQRCFVLIENFFTSSKDPLGWSKLHPVFNSLLQSYNPPGKRNWDYQAEVLQLSFSLLSLRQRQLSYSFLSLLHKCCLPLSSSPALIPSDKLLPTLAEALLPRGRRSRALFQLLVERCQQLFVIPHEIYEKAVFLKQTRFDPHLLTQSVYCQQVTREEYRRITHDATQSAIKDLMEHILDDSKLSLREKRCKIQLLRRSHPAVFEKYFAHYL